MATEYQPRRTCLSVPASSERFISKARDLAVDEVMLDLEDSVAPGSKSSARALAVSALNAGGFSGAVALRINDATTPWAYQDVIAAVTGAPGRVGTLILPKTSSPSDVIWLDTLLTQVEQSAGVAVGTTRIEVQIEDASGLLNVDDIAAASPRLAALIFGPGDFMASVGMKSVTVGGQPADYPYDAHHYTLMKILVAARAHGLQAIDGPYGRIKDLDGLRSVTSAVAALGFDGKWVLHPGQVDIVNSAFTPSSEEYARALRILSAYSSATSGSASSEARGAVMLDDEMIDEATRKMAQRVAALGEAAGLPRP